MENNENEQGNSWRLGIIAIHTHMSVKKKHKKDVTFGSAQLETSTKTGEYI